MNQQLLYPIPMVALKHYEALFRRTSASAICLQFRSKVSEVNALRVDTLNNRSCLAPFSSLKADFDKLLLHADGSAYTQIHGEPTSGTYFRHYFVQLLLFGDSI